MTRFAIIVATILTSLPLGASAVIETPKMVIWNASASAPIGLYLVTPTDGLSVTDLVAVMPPPLIAEFLSDRGYLPVGTPMMKRVLALPGATVCRRGLEITVFDIVVGQAHEHDKAGRIMPVWKGCISIPDDEVFLMNFDVSDSVDGRYFGPTSRTSIIGRAVPLWTDEDDHGRFQWRADALRLSPHVPTINTK